MRRRAVTLPPHPRVPAAPPAPDGVVRVLVCDDSAVIRELIAVNLQLEGFEVTSAADGQAALDLAVELAPDVITLDVRMPRMSGFDVVARLRDDPATAWIPIVMVTGRAQAADVSRGEALGVEAYLTKPFDPNDLVDLAERLTAGE